MTHRYSLLKTSDMPYSNGNTIWFASTELPLDYEGTPLPGQEIYVFTEDELPQPLYCNYKTDDAHGDADPFLRYVRIKNAVEVGFYDDPTLTSAFTHLDPIAANLFKFVWARVAINSESERLQKATEAYEGLKAALASNQSN